MWKVFAENSIQRPQFLFHGVRGSRIVPLDQWLEAEIKWRKEGSNPYYWTAFHVYRTMRDIRQWCRLIRIFDDRYAVRVRVDSTRKKPTNGHAILAEKLLVTSKAWDERIPLLSCVI